MKKHLLRLAFINGLLFLSICIFAQEYSDFYFTRVNGENGLSESNVKAILQDSYGFMWFGTKIVNFDYVTKSKLNNLNVLCCKIYCKKKDLPIPSGIKQAYSMIAQ